MKRLSHLSFALALLGVGAQPSGAQTPEPPELTQVEWDAPLYWGDSSPGMASIGYWSVTVDLGAQEPDQEQIEIEGCSAYAEAQASGAQIFADISVTLYDSVDGYLQESLGASTQGWFSISLTWVEIEPLDPEEPQNPPATCSISVDLKPKFDMRLGVLGTAGTTLYAAMEISGHHTEAYASAKKSIWAPHHTIPAGDELADFSDDPHEAHLEVSDEDSGFKFTYHELVSGYGEAITKAGGHITQDDEFVSTWGRIEDSKPGVLVFGLATSGELISWIMIDYGWY